MLFYHLERDPLERVLPPLVEKCAARGWRCVIQAASQERVSAINDMLWMWRDDSFIPHGTAEDGVPQDQPVFLTETDENPNGARVRFFVDGVRPTSADGYERLVYLFDGADANAVTTARETWVWGRDAGLDVTYWQQSPNGSWEKKAGD